MPRPVKSARSIRHSSSSANSSTAASTSSSTQSRKQPLRKCTQVPVQQFVPAAPVTVAPKKERVVQLPPNNIVVDTVSIRSELNDAHKDNPANWPNTARFETIAGNVIGDTLSASMENAVRLGNLPENQICCSCSGNCLTTYGCECARYAEMFRKKFKGKKLTVGSEMNVRQSSWDADYWTRPRFNCGPNCSCNKTTCQLKALEEIDEDHEKKFKIIRKNDTKGFVCITKQSFKKGIPIASFNGELTSLGSTRNKIDSRYCLQLTDNQESRMINFLNSLHGMDEEFQRTLKMAFRTNSVINPTGKGNFTRFLSHSCDPNLNIIKVFVGGISPNRIRIVFIPKRDIEEHEEITFNYGEMYKKIYLNDSCLCEKCVGGAQPNGNNAGKNKATTASPVVYKPNHSYKTRATTKLQDDESDESSDSEDEPSTSDRRQSSRIAQQQITQIPSSQLPMIQNSNVQTSPLRNPRSSFRNVIDNGSNVVQQQQTAGSVARALRNNLRRMHSDNASNVSRQGGTSSKRGRLNSNDDASTPTTSASQAGNVSPMRTSPRKKTDGRGASTSTTL